MAVCGQVLLETRTNGWTDAPPPEGTSSQEGNDLVTLAPDAWFADACLCSGEFALFLPQPIYR